VASVSLVFRGVHAQEADTVNHSIGNRIIGSNGRDKLGSNLSIIVKILVMDSNCLTNMGMEAKLAALTTKKQSIRNRVIGSDGGDNLGSNLSIVIKVLTVVFDGWKALPIIHGWKVLPIIHSWFLALPIIHSQLDLPMGKRTMLERGSTLPILEGRTLAKVG